VIYKLREDQAAQIAKNIIETGYAGNVPSEGDEAPCIVVKVWSPGCINGQVFLDAVGSTMWVTSALEGDAPGQWHWPVIKAATTGA
jgi:hypothetical protein